MPDNDAEVAGYVYDDEAVSDDPRPEVEVAEEHSDPDVAYAQQADHEFQDDPPRPVEEPPQEPAPEVTPPERQQFAADGTYIVAGSDQPQAYNPPVHLHAADSTLLPHRDSNLNVEEYVREADEFRTGRERDPETGHFVSEDSE